MNAYKIFISHGINYSEAYYTVEKWLNEAMNSAGGFSWVNCSASGGESDNPDDDADKILFGDDIKNQISDSAILIVISDLYNENKKLLNLEIKTAKQYGKYIIALKRWRNLRPVPRKILKSADDIVNLCPVELINAISQYNKVSEPLTEINSPRPVT